jgi:hypothetical protein
VESEFWLLTRAGTHRAADGGKLRFKSPALGSRNFSFFATFSANFISNVQIPMNPFLAGCSRFGFLVIVRILIHSGKSS